MVLFCIQGDVVHACVVCVPFFTYVYSIPFGTTPFSSFSSLSSFKRRERDNKIALVQLSCLRVRIDI